MQNSQTNTFLKGMNLDTAKEFVGTDQYIDALNVHINTNDGATAGTLQPYTDITIQDSDLSGVKICGTTFGHIWYQNKKHDCYIVLSYTDDKSYLSVYCDGDNGFDLKWELSTTHFELNRDENAKLINIYENSETSRVYISQKDSYIQVVNINKPSDYYNNVTDFSIFPKCGALPPFRFNKVIAGNKMAGKVQYAYQLFNSDGKTTALSAISHTIPIGSELNGDLTDKGISIILNDISEKYEYIRIFALSYTNFSDLPRVYVKDELKISNAAVIYNDVADNYLSEYTLEQFQSIKSAQFKSGTIETKDNRLFAANIIEQTFDVDFDARVYSANRTGFVKIENEDILLTNIVNGNKLIREDFIFNNPNVQQYKFNTTTQIDNSGDVVEYPYGGAGPKVSYIFIRPLLYLAPNTQSCVDNGIQLVSRDLEQNQYSADGTNTINVLCDNIVDNNLEIHSIYKDSDVDHVIKNVTYADPYMCSNYTGFKQGESYTFGIIFYNDQNIASPVHVIGNIDIPYFDDWIFSAVSLGYDQGQHDLVATTVGIRFKIDLSGLDDVCAYEIVRVQKTTDTRKVLMQGITSNTVQYTGNHGSYGIESVGEHDLRNPMYPTTRKTFYSMFNYYSNPDHTGYQRSGELSTNGNYAVFVSPEISINKENVENALRKAKNLKTINELSSLLYQKDIGTSLVSKVLNYGYLPIFQNIAYATSSESVTVSSKGQQDYNKFVGIPFGWTDVNGSDKYVGIPVSAEGIEVGHAMFKYYTPSGYNNTLDIQTIKFCKALSSDNLDTNVVTESTIVGNKTFVNVTSQDNTNDRDRSGVHCNCAVMKFYGNTQLQPGTTNPVLMHVNWSENDNYKSYESKDPLAWYDGVTRTSYTYEGPDKETVQWDDLRFDITQTTRTTAVLADLCTDYVPSLQFSMLSQLQFVSTGQYIKVDNSDKTSYINCFGGDTYVCIHKELWSGVGYGKDNYSGINGRNSIHIKYPVETRVNLDLVSGPNFDSDPNNPYFTFEPAQLATHGAQELPLNAYNDAYSAQEYNKVFVTKGMWDIQNQHIGNRIMVSEVKSTGELTDSFQDFRVANYLDVDGQYGDITNLVKYNDRLYYLQSTAFGTVAVNERSLITDNNNAALLLGTGDVLQRYDYISTFDGNQNTNDYSIVVSPSSLYWYDSQKHSFNVFNQGGLNSLSKIKYVQSFFNKLPSNTIVHAGYDNRYNELWISSDNDKSIIYSEQTQAFVGYYSTPIRMSETFGSFSLALTKDNKFVRFGEPNEEAALTEANVTFVVNKDIQLPKTFDTLVFVDCFQNNNTGWFTAKFNTGRQGNETLYFDSVYKEGVYYTAVGRDANKQRMRDKIMTVKLNFNAKTFGIPSVSTIFRYSKI